MNKVILAIIVLWLASLACGSSAPTTVDDYIQEYGGNPDVYNKILSLTDCTLLQEEFDIASENNQRAAAGTAEHKETTGYMVAADARMKELNCYDESNVSQFIAQTSNAANTQTQAAITPTLLITSTNLPTLTQPVIPSQITIEAATTIPLPTNTVVFVLPTNPPPAGSTCSCAGDTLNCSDFSSQSSAQACMDYCVSIGAGDIHNLDGDANGLACEDLP